MPLIREDCMSEPARSALARQKPKVVFPESRTPEAALAGLYLYFGCWEEAHAFAAAGSPEAAIGRRVQLSEWQLLFDYCARGLNR